MTAGIFGQNLTNPWIDIPDNNSWFFIYTFGSVGIAVCLVASVLVYARLKRLLFVGSLPIPQPTI
jgi:hypothetical protein